MKIWNFGIIGCGGIADFHIEAIKGLSNVNLTAVSSRDKTKAATVGNRVQCDWSTDYRTLLQRPDIDIVAVTTSSGSHAEIGKDVLRAGKHLIVEKPMAMKTADAEELISLARERRLTLSVISQRRFESQHQTLKELVDKGSLGKLLLVEATVPFFREQSYYDSAAWRGTITEDGGALMNQGIHSVDLLLWLCGFPVTVCGKIATQTHDMEAEDLGLAIIRFANGTFGTIMASTSIQPGFPTELNVYGENGAVKIVGSDIAYWFIPGVEPPPAKNAKTAYGGSADPLRIGHWGHQLQIADIIEAIETGREPLVTGEQGLQCIRLIEAIYESSKQSAEIQLYDV